MKMSTTTVHLGISRYVQPNEDHSQLVLPLYYIASIASSVLSHQYSYSLGALLGRLPSFWSGLACQWGLAYMLEPTELGGVK